MNSCCAQIAHPVGSVRSALATTYKAAPIVEVEAHLSKDMLRNDVPDGCSGVAIDKPRLNENVVQEFPGAAAL